MSASALNLLETGWKHGKEFIGKDPFDAAVSLFGKTVVGTSLSKISTSQCAGLIGMIVSTVAPEV